jgi:hypothetical protein
MGFCCFGILECYFPERVSVCYPPCSSDASSVDKITRQHGRAAHLLLARQVAREISICLSSACLPVILHRPAAIGVTDRSVSVTDSAVFSAGGEGSM